jgi:hypothetical protein
LNAKLGLSPRHASRSLSACRGGHHRGDVDLTLRRAILDDELQPAVLLDAIGDGDACG